MSMLTLSGKLTFALLLAAALALLSAPAQARSWFAQPIVVHEWGVNTFDWAAVAAHDPQLPGFVYTDQRPGEALGQPAQRARDLPPDNGVRTKPILYFYPPPARGNRHPTLDVEARFAFGFAAAWYPQVSVYRTADEVADAEPIDWSAWASRVNALDPRAARLAVPVPEDPRFELVWNGLSLSESVPDGMRLPESGMPDDHWWRVARDVPGAAYVSNGQEVERFLFYEGKTRERPAVAVLAGDVWVQRDGARHVVNISDDTIYDVLVIYRDPEGRRWVGYRAVMEPVPSKQAGEHVAASPQCINLPDFTQLADDVWLDGDAFSRLTRDRLASAMVDGDTLPRLHGVMMRDPADPQQATTAHQLYPIEAAGLLTIWHDDFFEADGLTILFRESPAYLDRAMPLNIYTDMYHYIQLSRCGWVLNQNVPLDPTQDVMQAVERLLYQHSNAPDWEQRMDAARELCRANRLMALGCLAYFERQRGEAGQDRTDGLRQLLDDR